jgi:hypothetical protein
MPTPAARLGLLELFWQAKNLETDSLGFLAWATKQSRGRMMRPLD